MSASYGFLKGLYNNSDKKGVNKWNELEVYSFWHFVVCKALWKLVSAEAFANFLWNGKS